MAQITQLVSDISGALIGDDGGTVVLTIDGDRMELDMTGAEIDAFNKAVKPYVDAARHQTRPTLDNTPRRTRTKSATPAGRTDKAELAKMKEWLAANGFTVPQRGRISAEMQEAYHKANG